jgi:hypothetical protein
MDYKQQNSIEMLKTENQDTSNLSFLNLRHIYLGVII